MKLCAFDIPDDPTMLASWLEEQLMGVELRQLVTELEVMRGPADQSLVSLDDVLGRQRGPVLEGGLDSLSRVQLRQLLRQPGLILDLQRVVLDEGGDYWSTVPAAAEIEAMSAATWTGLQTAIRAQRVRPRRRYWPTLLTGLAAAAAVLFAVVAYDQWWRPTPSAPFAWTTPQDWPPGGAPIFFGYLADEAERYWTSASPESAVALATRLSELREGCSILLVHGNSELNKENAAWLHERCLTWSKRLDRQRDRLETGGEAEVADVRSQVDTLIHDLTTALRARGRRSAPNRVSAPRAMLLAVLHEDAVRSASASA